LPGRGELIVSTDGEFVGLAPEGSVLLVVVTTVAAALVAGAEVVGLT
jgi:hypothetical protein